MSSAYKQLYSVPIADRPPHGPLFSKVFFPIFFTLAQIGIGSAQLLFMPLLLVPFVGKRAFTRGIEWTKDGYGRLLIAITVLFGPTSFTFTSDVPPLLDDLVQNDSQGRLQKINLPDRLVIMANHQSYLDWIYLWIICAYAGHSRGLVIMLKASLKNVPLLGWGMQLFKFIFLQRSWAADRSNLTLALRQLGKEAQSTDDASESASLLRSESGKRSPLWLMMFPEGTIINDDERPKSKKHAEREGIDDFETLLHPRTTGLLFCLRTLLPQIPDLQLLDITIGYPGVPFGRYPEDWYGLFSVFLKSVPPPTVHIHLHLNSHLTHPDCEIPSLSTKSLTEEGEMTEETGLASKEESRAFELWLRKRWGEKEKRLKYFYKHQRFEGEREVVQVRQQHWYHWIAACGGGGLGTALILAWAFWYAVR
ncbi:acyltransferase [Cryptococcus wingfieldii CBS 7118]|uniref:Acyltransferase n=1 Tax=Cryptococcus wingfieldii CBS 7118 TaxID=1295528 RepID=A0A1E3JCD9_9TREE|nr:acyltransferase [Cryptococcus wingfieldii CBS 7118]ODN98540.1 acyltransferase [Cryptococcus wingfieldii CBS 7118]